MRILKTKLLLSQKQRQEKVSINDLYAEESPTEIVTQAETTSPEEIYSESSTPKTKLRRKIPGGHITPENIRCAKNIAKNYGRAISSFACSKLAEPYLLPILQTERVSLKEFIEYIKATKSSIKGIDTFRAMLLVKQTDNEKVSAYKRVFREIGKVFVNYFSVNWICSSRIVHKRTYLKFRFKVLRRIANPELFTYLKG